MGDRPMTTGERTDPYLDFRFRVELDGLLVGGFAEVRGLEVELETEEYEEGGLNRHAHVLPTRFRYPNLVLRRGVTDSRELWEWMARAMYGVPERKSGRIVVLDATGREARGWAFREGYPVRWEGPELEAGRGETAIEALEIAHHGLEAYNI